MSKQLLELCKELGIKNILTDDGKVLHNYASAIDIFRAHEKIIENEKAISLMPIHANHILSRTNASFYGCSVDAFGRIGKGSFDMATFLQEKEKYKNISLRLKEEAGKVAPMRKRKFSEHDGEYIFERQYEVSPFSATYRTNEGIKPTLKINVDFAFNCNVQAEDITKYGAFIWVIADAIENSGITCEISMEVSYGTRGALSKGDACQVLNAHTHTKIKNAGEYIDAKNLARCFTPMFYRRGTFLMRNVSFEAFGTKINDGLGQSKPQGKSRVEPGVLNLCVDDSQRPDQEKIVKDILAAVTGKEG